MKNALQGWVWLIPTILLSSPAFLVSCSEIIMTPFHVQMSSSNFSNGITLSKLNDEEFVWLRIEGEYKTAERGRNSWRQTKRTLVSLITTHAKGVLLQVFAKYCAVKVHLGFCVKRSGTGVGFFWVLQFLSVFPLREKDIDNRSSRLYRNIKRFHPVYKTAFFMFLGNDGIHCN